MCMFALPMVFPVNILYPLTLDVIPETKSRAAAVVNITRLTGSAICIELISYFYNGNFLHLGLLLFGFSIVGLLLSRKVTLKARF